MVRLEVRIWASGGLAISEGVFRARVRKNALARAVLPAEEAMPYYTAGSVELCAWGS